MSEDEADKDWHQNITDRIERIKRRRRIPLSKPLRPPRNRFDQPGCGVTGCPCHHTPYRGCDRGDIHTTSGTGPDQHETTRRCPTCQQYAQHKQREKKMQESPG